MLIGKDVFKGENEAEEDGKEKDMKSESDDGGRGGRRPGLMAGLWAHAASIEAWLWR